MVENNLGGIGGIFMLGITILIGAILFTHVGEETAKVTQFALSNTSNASISQNQFVNVTSGYFYNSSAYALLPNDNIKSVTWVKTQNSSGITLVENTDYVLLKATGQFRMINSATNTKLTILAAQQEANNTLIEYIYVPDTYVEDGTSRTLLGFIPLFFAIAVLLVGVVYIVKRLQEV